MRKNVLTSLIALAFIFQGNVAEAGASKFEGDKIQVVIEPQASPETVFNWQKNHCDGTWTIPDAPARAYRDNEQRVHLFAAVNSNWSMIGPSLDNLTTRCNPAFVGGRRADPHDFDDEAWIEGTFTYDGGRVLALLSNDSHPDAGAQNESFFPTACLDSKSTGCHYYSITSAFSDNGGLAFKYMAPHHVVATSPFQDLSGKNAVMGAATSSNIFENSGFVYVFIGLRTAKRASSGSCLFRSQHIFDPSQWDVWDGRRFSPNVASDLAAICEPVKIPFPDPVELRSVNYFGGCQCYIGVFQGSRVAGEKKQVGFFYTISKDLVSWGVPQLLLSVPTVMQCREILVYPSLLDPQARSRNFTDITDHPFLYYTRMNRKSCKGTADRDLLRLPLSIVKYPPS